MKNFKSYGFWTALAGAIVVLLNALGKCLGFAIEEQIITDIIMAIAGVLVVFGVVSMPKNDENKTDTQEETKTIEKNDKAQTEGLEEGGTLKDEEKE